MNKIKRIYLLSAVLIMLAFSLRAQLPETDSLFLSLQEKDSLLFDVGFNTCDVNQFEVLVHEDFEFYHDQSGITPSKEAFMKNTEEGLCNLDYQPIRKLEAGSLEVFLLKNDGAVYGAIQKGIHHFYAQYSGEPLQHTSSARFTHIWKKEGEDWKLFRVLSYDHQPGSN